MVQLEVVLRTGRLHSLLISLDWPTDGVLPRSGGELAASFTVFGASAGGLVGAGEFLVVVVVEQSAALYYHNELVTGKMVTHWDLDQSLAAGKLQLVALKATGRESVMIAFGAIATGFRLGLVPKRRWAVPAEFGHLS